MEIYLDHPHNGAMVAYSLAEAAEWEKKGWTVRQPEPVPAEEEVAAPKRPRKA